MIIFLNVLNTSMHVLLNTYFLIIYKCVLVFARHLHSFILSNFCLKIKDLMKPHFIRGRLVYRGTAALC